MKTKRMNRFMTEAPREAANIEWNYSGPPDGFFGPGATGAERGVVWLGVFLLFAAYAGLEFTGRGPEWSWWLWAIVLGLGADIAGGMIANSLNSCKRYYHRGATSDARSSPAKSGVGVFLRNHVAFAAVHVHPIFVGWLFDRPLYGLGWYLVLQMTVWATLCVPLYLRRPLAMLWILAVLLVELYFVAPIPYLEWFIPVLFIKIVYGRIVREEPYRPVD